MSKSRLLRHFLSFLFSAIMIAPVAMAGVIPGFLQDRWRGPTVRVRNIEGLGEHVRDGKLYLRLNEFLALVLKNNTEIQMTRLDVLTAANSILDARAIFDPAINVNFSTSRANQPQYNQINGAEQLNSLSQQGQIAFEQTLSTGQTVSAGFNSYRNSSNSAFVFFNPSITTGLDLAITQPLLRDRNRIQLRAPMRIAKTMLQITSDQSEARIADLVANAARQYWDAVEARENIRVQQLSVNLAQKSYDRDRMALELGALSQLEIYQSQSQVAQRKVGVIQAQASYREMVDSVRRLIGADLDPAIRGMEIVFDDDPASLPLASPLQSAEDTLQQALAHRPELMQVRRHYEIDDLNASMARNSMLPRLDLGVQAGAAGLGGNQIPITGPLGIVSGFVQGGLGDALRQTFSFTSPYYGFSLQMTLPARSSSAEARLANARVSRARDKYQERQMEQQVIREVKTALNQVESGEQQIEAAKIARDLAQKNVDAEQQKYEAGSITAFELLDAQNRLASLEGSLVSAYTSYQRALVVFKRANWTLLDGMGIIVEAPKVR